MKVDMLITELCTEIDQLKDEMQEIIESNVYWREKYNNALKYNTKTDKPTVKIDLVEPELNKFMTDFYCKMNNNMENLIAALQIFLRYKNVPNPIFIYDRVMVINNISPKEVSDEDKQTLKELGFYVDLNRNCFKSNIPVYC
jgi:hypothetical protein